MTGATGQLWSRDGWDNTRIKMVEARAGLDGLAALLVAAQWARMNGHISSESRLCKSICRMLLIVGLELYRLGVARPLAELVDETVLARSVISGLRYKFWDKGYLAALQLLHQVVNTVERNLPKGARPERMTLIRELLDDSYSIDLSHLIIQAEAGGQ